jgi:hypothetical protein
LIIAKIKFLIVFITAWRIKLRYSNLLIQLLLYSLLCNINRKSDASLFKANIKMGLNLMNIFLSSAYYEVTFRRNNDILQHI